jgi:hypothetical protein
LLPPFTRYIRLVNAKHDLADAMQGLCFSSSVTDGLTCGERAVIRVDSVVEAVQLLKRCGEAMECESLAMSIVDLPSDGKGFIETIERLIESS